MKLTQKQIQTQKLLPKQIIFAKLVQLPTYRLEEAIENELEENPVLEIDYDATKSKQDESKVKKDDDGIGKDEEQFFNWEDIYSSEGSNDFKPVSTYDASATEKHIIQAEKKYFIDDLLDQIYRAGLDDDEIQIAEELIGDLDESGYLSTPPENIAYKLDIPVKTIKKVLSIVQKLDPIGIGSRNLQECLLLQITERGEKPFVAEIIKNYFDEFANHDYEKIMKSLRISKEEMKYAKDTIGKLNPKPGYIDSEFSNHYILPDLIVTKVNGEFVTRHNDSHIPELHLSKKYQEMLVNRDKLDKNTAEYLKSKLNSASWFIESILQRRNTMLKVMNAIIEEQKDFFMGQGENLKPMKLSDIAEKIEMDISTVSRVTNGKYVQTPIGLYELKYFFTEGLQKKDGNFVSRNKIMEKLKEIISNENKKSPLKDEDLAIIMGDNGYNVARRTISKYRKIMNIQNAKLRREI